MRYRAALYNTVHPHKALDYRSPREFRKQMVEKTTENAVGAVRRPHGGTMAKEAVGSRPSAAYRAVARSASLCVGHVRQFGGESPLCNLMEVKH